MTTQAGQQIILVHILFNISRIRQGNKAMETWSVNKIWPVNKIYNEKYFFSKIMQNSSRLLLFFFYFKKRFI